MTHQDLTAEALQRGASPGRGYVFASLVSKILHPIPLSIFSMLLVGVFSLPTMGRGLAWAGLCILMQIVPSVLFFTVRLRQGAYTDEDVSVRQQRNEVYLFGLLNLSIGLIILLWLGAPGAFVAMVGGALAINIICWIINVWWKISVHSAGMGTTVAVALIYSPALGAVMSVCALLLGWARVRTRNHTPMQVVAGMSLAIACIFIAFRLVGQI